MADHDDHLDAELDVFFTATKRLAPRPSEELQARILMEATRAQKRPAPKPSRVSVFECSKISLRIWAVRQQLQALQQRHLLGLILGFPLLSGLNQCPLGSMQTHPLMQILPTHLQVLIIPFWRATHEQSNIFTP